MHSQNRRDTIVSTLTLFLIILFCGATGFARNLSVEASERLVVESAIENPAIANSAVSSLYRVERYDWLTRSMHSCARAGGIGESPAGIFFAPANTLCIGGGSLAVSDPVFNRPAASATGSGLGTNCTLSATGTATRYDQYTFNLTGCSAFPSVLTFSLCGPGGCAAAAGIDTVLVLYRRVAAGDPLTASGGIATAFNSAFPCANAVALNDETGSVPASPGGSTCNQSDPSDCMPACSPSTSLSQLKRNLGSGFFTIVVTGFSNTVTGSYNLTVNAPGAGCNVTLLTVTAAVAGISGGVKTPAGRGIANATVTLNGGGMSQPLTVRTNAFGYYSFPAQGAGSTYVLSVSAKGRTFAEATRLVTLNDEIDDADFVSID